MSVQWRPQQNERDGVDLVVHQPPHCSHVRYLTIECGRSVVHSEPCVRAPLQHRILQVRICHNTAISDTSSRTSMDIMGHTAGQRVPVRCFARHAGLQFAWTTKNEPV